MQQGRASLAKGASALTEMLTASSLYIYILFLMFNGNKKPDHMCLILFFKKVLKG